MSSSIRPPVGNLTLFLFVYIPQVVLGQHYVVTADHPKGCKGGPGPGKGSVIPVLSAGSCIFNMRGYNRSLVYQESAGFILKTHMPDHSGSLKVQIKVGGDMVHTFETPNISVEISGWAHLGFDHGDAHFWWNPAASTKHYRPSDEGAVRAALDSIFHVSFTGGQRGDTDWHSISGSAVSNGMNLYAHSEQRRSSAVSFQVDFKVSVDRVEGGWNFHVGFDVRGSYGPKAKSVYHDAVDFIKGVLYG
ncbi:hypothetical protein FOZ60_009798 [Perkinsus olseni]|uniref:Uncharacterized protein n=1 Tax=Perkinsus olseni TaxID=32597 RepID=A0A7J6NGK9_PEROL|nr:hypothetical protein FOZ60_009798 [Perkinsus olseni]